MTQPIQIIIVDDHPLIKEGIKQILSLYETIHIVGEGSNGQEALDLVASKPCDILLLDINMPVLNGLEVVQQLKVTHPHIPILLLTVQNDYPTLKKAITLNINGYILKESAGSTLINAIKTIYDGNHYIDPALTKNIFKLIKHSPINTNVSETSTSSQSIDTLSSREKEILFYISQDLTNKEIGIKLFLSEKTIRNSLTKIFKKIQVKDRIHAKAFAIEHNIML